MPDREFEFEFQSSSEAVSRSLIVRVSAADVAEADDRVNAYLKTLRRRAEWSLVRLTERVRV